MSKQETDRFLKILDVLQEEYPGEFEGLNYTSPLELLIATMLSAQCTDARVNTVTPNLFAKYKTVDDYINIPIEQLELDIHPTGYYKAKAKNIKACSTMIKDQFNSELPRVLEDLIKLPGVGRKTANCVLMHCYGEQAITVDTHVIRLTNLMGFVNTNDAVTIEYQLMNIVPKQRWNDINRLLITHGRKVCIARRPQCDECRVKDYCPSQKVN